MPPLPGWDLHFCVQFIPKHFLRFGGCCDRALPLLFLAVFIPGKWTGCWCCFVCCWFARSGWCLLVESVGLLCSYRLQTGVLYFLSFAVVFIVLIRKSRQFAFQAFIKMYVVLPFILLFCNVWFSPKLCLFEVLARFSLSWGLMGVASSSVYRLSSVMFSSADVRVFSFFRSCLSWSFSSSSSSEAWLRWIIQTDNHCHSEHGIQNFVSSWLIGFLLRNWQIFLYIRLGTLEAFNFPLFGSVYLVL